jgi:hypothetical protein
MLIYLSTVATTFADVNYLLKASKIHYISKRIVHPKNYVLLHIILVSSDE